MDFSPGVHYVRYVPEKFSIDRVNDSLYSDRQVWRNSVDPDQTAPYKQSEQGILSAYFRHNYDKTLCSNFRINTAIVLVQLFFYFTICFMYFRSRPVCVCSPRGRDH